MASQTVNTITTAGPLLKELYGSQKAKIADYENHPFYAMVPKKTNFVGKTMPLPIVYSHGGGRSGTFATALANADGIESEAFDLKRVKGYAICKVDGEVAEASAGKLGSFLDMMVAEMDGKRRALVNMIASNLYRTASGSLALVTPAAGASFTVASLGDIVNFYVDQRLVSGGSATDGGGTLDAVIATVTAVNRDTGVVTCSLSSGTDLSSEWGASVHVYEEGTFGDGTVGHASASLAGLGSWIPASAPGATAFFGVDRSVDTTRLGGIRYDGSALPIAEALINASARASREGAKPDHCFMNPVDWARLAISLESKVVYDKAKAKDADISFDAIRLMTPSGPVKVISDPDCPQNTSFLLQLDTWKLCSIGDCPKLLALDGNNVLRVYNADQVEARFGFYAQLGCEYPGANVRITLPSA